jgi:hypothetical protein
MKLIKIILYNLIFLAALIGVASCGGSSSNIVQNQSELGKAPELLQKIPYDETRKAILLFKKTINLSEWQVLREWPNGEIRFAVRSDPNQPWRDLKFLDAATVHLSQVVDSFEAIYLFTYDVEKNSPSGRSIMGVKEGIDLWRLDLTNSKINLVAEGLELGGIDNLLTARAKSGKIDVCTINKCLNISDEGEVREWTTKVTEGYELVEVNFIDDDAYALIRRVDNRVTGNPDYTKSIYAAETLIYPGSNQKTIFRTVPNDCLPFRLRWEDRQPNWSCAKNAQEMAEVVKHDLKRIPHNGIGEIGLNNSEGRIAWGLVYHLNAISHLTTRFLPKLSLASDWSDEYSKLRGALDLVARQDSATDLGYGSRRYSLNRTPLLFALHLGRIAHLLSTANEAGFGSSETKKTHNELIKKLKQLEGTVEVPIIDGSYATLGYRKSADFWADGSNVPYNYISGYVHGLLTSSAIESELNLRAKELMRPILELENLEKEDSWQYWWGRGKNGWTESEGVSSNTLSYSGYTGIAHISYRSMDAMAVIRLASVDSLFVDTSVIKNIRRLVGKGYLLPFVNQELARLGEVQKIESNVAIRFGRSSTSSELHAQIFAIESLLGN